MSFKDISYLEFWQPVCLWSETIFAILVMGILRNNSVKLFFNLVQWFRCCLKDLSGALSALQWRGTIYAIL